MTASVFSNVHLATMVDGYGELPDGAVRVEHGRIAWVGRAADADTSGATVIDGAGAWLTPGLIDCHTHIVHAGNRSGEFEARLNGATYQDIARAGGGIMATVRATRAATQSELLAQSAQRVVRLLAEGVTTLEIKSGYGLDLPGERAMLTAARSLGRRLPVRVVTSFLGAHALPPEFAGDADGYIDHLIKVVMPALAAEGLVDAVDAFCETIGFSLAQTERLFSAAAALGLPIKLHAEQLSDQGGAALVARFKGLSADHLEHLSEEGVAAMAQAGTVAVLLPGAYYFLRDTTPPPVARLRTAGVPMALATDCNPGTSPLTSLLLAMNLACTLWRLTPLEALAGVTIHAARALGLQHDIGSIEVGKRADFALWRVARPAELAYAMGFNPCIGVVNGGVWRAPVVSWDD
jgi:imidazolonepropionase